MLNYEEFGLMSNQEVEEAVQFSINTDTEVMDVTAAVWIKVALALGSAAAAAL